MESGAFVGIDHGGTTTTSLVLGGEGRKLASVSVAMPKQTPRPGWVEHDPEDFLRTSLESAGRALDEAGLSWGDVRGVGIANQGETSMAWSRETGRCIGPALSWEDRRTVEICSELASQGVDELVRARTGVRLDPYFSAAKFRWLIDNVPEVAAARAQGLLRLGGTDAYVIDRLTRGAVHATDAATASRTALLNLRRVCWDADLLAAFGLDDGLMPHIRLTAGDFGAIARPDLTAKAIPITADAVDAHAALFAQGCWDSTIAKATYGTGAFIEVNTGSTPVEPDANLPVFIAWELAGGVEYALEGGVFSVGSAVDWTVRSGLLPSASASESLAEGVVDSGGVLMVPAFTGLAAPHWEPRARACFLGLGLDTQPGHIARALLDGIAFQCADILLALNHRLGGGIAAVRADGGPTRNRYLMQRQADLLGMPVTVSSETDMTALGAALLAALGAGQLTLDDIASMRNDGITFDPEMSDDERELRWSEWRRGVEMVSEWADP